MKKLKENECHKISEYVFLCYVSFETTPRKYLYVVAINSYPKMVSIQELEIFGFGETIEIALISAVRSLTEAALKGVPLTYLKELAMGEIYDMMQEGTGCIETSETGIEVEDPDYSCGEKYSIFIDEDGKAWPAIF